MNIRITVDDAALKRALKDPQLIAGPLKDFLAQSALTVEGQAKQLAPVDTGRLRASITSVLQPTQARVQASVFYAPHVEFGTRPHWPPLAAMQPWAGRHGFPKGRLGAFLVARAIARRGTRPHPFMRPSAERSLPAIRGFLRDMALAIERRWKR